MLKTEFELIDLQDVYDEKLLNTIYNDLYLPSFPIPEEQEDPSIWKPLLWGSTPRKTNPVLHVLVTGINLDKSKKRRVFGAIFAELYKESKCGLLTYLAVHPDYRHQGLGKYLLTEAIQRLKVDARNNGETLKAVFGEINDPRKVTESQDSMKPSKRMRIIAKLGAKLVPIHYVQPELKPGQGRSDSLLLVVFPINKKPMEFISAKVIFAFLREFYKVQGVQNPDKDKDLINTMSNIKVDFIKTRSLTPRLSIN